MPVLLGIPALIGAIGTFISSIFGAVVAYVAQRGIRNVLYLAAMATATIAFIVFIDTQLTALINTASAYQYGSFLTSVLPAEMPTYISICLAADVARWVHDYTQAAINRKFH